MSLILWATIGALLGVLGFALLPVILAHAGGVETRERIGQWFVSLGMGALDDATMVVRKQGGLSLVSVSFDPKFRGDKVTVDGVVGHVQDNLAAKSRLSNKPFGLSLESHSEYITPLWGELADIMSEAKEEDRIGLLPDGGYRMDFTLPERSQLPQLRETYRIFPGNSGRRFGKISESWTEKSQEGFHSRVSLGQAMLWIMAFAVASGLGWFIMSYGGDAGSNAPSSIPVGGLLLLAAPAFVSDRRLRQLRLAGLLAAVVIVFWALVVFVAMFYGLLTAIIFFFMVAMFAVGPWLLVRLLGAGMLFNGAVGRGLFSLAQLAFGRGALIRADNGPYEWHALREDDDGFFATMNNGDLVEIDGDEGDLYRFGWRPLAVTEQKTDRNVAPFVAPEPGVRKPETRDVRQGKPIAHPGDQPREGWRVTATRIKKRVRGAAGAELVRNGRNKALEEEGGTQQVSALMTMLGAFMLLILGFTMTVGVMWLA